MSLTVPPWAAQFTEISYPTSKILQNLADVGGDLAKQETVFGDSSQALTISYEKKETEPDLNTNKQLSYQKGNANSDDKQTSLDSLSVQEQINFLFEAVAAAEPENQDAYDRARASRTEALSPIKASPSLKVFGSSHADEDGSWQILYISWTPKTAKSKWSRWLLGHMNDLVHYLAGRKLEGNPSF